jgi:predicted unusual protein kinase regulating ubiquinone biosynthesis (AarF/ABC1/UbiB family)
MAQVYKATWRVQTVAVKMLTHTTEKQMHAFMR